jgi:hypothetical protein
VDHPGDAVRMADDEGTDDEAAERVAHRDDRVGYAKPVEHGREFVGEDAVRLGRVGSGPWRRQADTRPVVGDHGCAGRQPVNDRPPLRAVGPQRRHGEHGRIVAGLQVRVDLVPADVDRCHVSSERRAAESCVVHCLVAVGGTGSQR